MQEIWKLMSTLFYLFNFFLYFLVFDIILDNIKLNEDKKMEYKMSTQHTVCFITFFLTFRRTK